MVERGKENNPSEPKLFQLTCPRGTAGDAREILNSLGIITLKGEVLITRSTGDNGVLQTIEKTGIYVTCYFYQQLLIKPTFERRAGWIPEVDPVGNEHFED